ncbi:ABC transporter ATP-binding protein [Algisphaera agarilytica]|uniref:Multiple sugar transport system ATP-binding protein n=1 Tax=Algisphaera agarilytica TaxID=1385975 RepID=A0A7X0H569_9BACT|nr:sn-glycerol-3-phosphate ABC transporter ATP-binding protein UgpC [Algisphaera agarilytica]MBB6429262.1 multiple sugar transport system ATP-binding protein [Algisphaera agarilytica]
MAQVTIKDVVKTYPGNVTAVKGINLEIADGEFMVLVGPSGCGKSTTLRMTAGLEEITGGTISIGDRVVNDVPPKDRDIAMVFQNYALYPHMTVYKNMAFGLKLRKFPKAEIDKRVREAAEILGITQLLDRKPKALSGGQRQRVALGRAIVRDPAVFLFDEPLSNLDAKLRVETRAEIKRLHKRLTTTTIYVTHDQEEAMTLGDRVCVMSEGLIQQCDTPITVYDRPVNRFVAAFLGTPPMNFFDGQLVAENGGTWFKSNHGVSVELTGHHAELAAGKVGSEVVMGVRPEGMFLRPTEFASTESQTVNMTVDVTEPLGNTMDVFLSNATNGEGDRATARVKAEPLEENASVKVYLDQSKIHYFEPGKFGVNLTLPELAGVGA